MPVITYTAKRKIVPLSPTWSKTGSDISAATADDSYNSTSTDLSGLSTGNYVKVSGFSNSANNGWHKVAATSTGNKITVSENLVDEAGGGIITIQGYEHGPGESYTLEKGAEIDYERRPVRDVQTALSGSSETMLRRTDRVWTINTVLLAQSELKYWLEFLASVEGGETFTLDPYGTQYTPDDPVSVILHGGGYRPRRAGPMHYRLQFQAREV